MSIVHRSAASLSFFGDDLDPDAITSALGGSPLVGVKKGETWVTARGTSKVASRGQWRIKAEEQSPADLDSQVADLLRPLTDDLVAWNHVASRFNGRLFCGLFLGDWNEMVRLSVDTIQSLSARGLMIDFDVYGVTRDEKE